MKFLIGSELKEGRMDGLPVHQKIAEDAVGHAQSLDDGQGAGEHEKIAGGPREFGGNGCAVVEALSPGGGEKSHE